MNIHESEKIAGTLRAMGYVECDDENQADVIVFNTCCIRDNAEKRALGNIGAFKHLKKANPNMILAVVGCMTQQDGAGLNLRQKYPYVDIVLGTNNLAELENAINKLKNTGKKSVLIDQNENPQVLEGEKKYRTSGCNAWLNIMYGCNNFCSYCIVPYVRGRERSRNPRDIIREIERLVSEGVVEVMLLGQNVNSYGKNLEEPISFAQLLQEVEQIEGLERIRFMTSHPKDLSDDLIEVMKNSKKICRHLHLPLQAGSTRILKAMNRSYTKEQYLALAHKIRQEIPDISLTTDIIVGFPGETAEDVEETIAVVRKVQYDNAFTFIYSKRTGTPAAAMPNPTSDEEIKANFDRLLKVVQETARSRVGRLKGEVHRVLVEEINEHDASLITGRLSNNTIVHFKGEPSLIGTLVDVKLTEAHGFYYIGEQVALQQGCDCDF